MGIIADLSDPDWWIGGTDEEFFGIPISEEAAAKEKGFLEGTLRIEGSDVDPNRDTGGLMGQAVVIFVAFLLVVIALGTLFDINLGGS